MGAYCSGAALIAADSQSQAISILKLYVDDSRIRVRGYDFYTETELENLEYVAYEWTVCELFPALEWNGNEPKILLYKLYRE